MLAKFGKFPFEHFAWGQTLLYYNHVNTETKDRILGKTWEAQLAMLVTGKKCWAGSVKKWLLKFFASGSTAAKNGTLACKNPCVPGEDYSIAARNDSRNNTYTFDSSSKGERLGGEPNTLV
jgi:hypothetical protein